MNGGGKLTVRECAKRGMSQNEAAAAMGVTVSCVCRKAKLEGVALRKVYDDAVLWPRLRKCAAKGMSLSETARHLKVSERRINKFRAANPDVLFQPSGRGRPQKPAKAVLTPSSSEAILAELNDGQRQDFLTLVKQGQYGITEAKAAVTRRKPKVSASPEAIQRYLAKAQDYRRRVA